LAATYGPPSAAEGAISRFHWKIEVIGGLPLALTAMDTLILSFALVQLVEAWHLAPMEIGAIAVAQAVGMLLGGVLIGNAADRIGRLLTLRLSLALTSLGTGLGAIAWGYLPLSMFQFIAGIGMAGVGPVVSAFVGEYAPARHRGQLSTGLELFWGLGSTLAALASLFILPFLGWRLAFVLGALPLLWALALGRFMPESPRYLVGQGRRDKARQIVARIKERYGLDYDHLMDQPASENKGLLSSVGELWSGPLMKRTLCTWLLWFVLVFTYYGIFMWLPTLMRTSGLEAMRTIQYMLVFLAAQMPAVAGAALLVDIVGRKRILITTLTLCGVSSYMFGRASSPGEILLWGSLLSLSNTVGYGVMLCYTSELFPTRLRATGAGLASSFGRLGGIAVPGAMALLISSWSTGYELVFIMFAVLLLLGALQVGFLGEETRGRTLEDIAI